MTKSSFLGGALSFKGGKKKSKKKSKKSKTKHKLKGDGIVTEISKSSSPQHGINGPDGMIDEFPSSSDEVDDDDELTDAERKALKFKKRSQQRESEKIAKQSHRERVEDMNEKLGNMTELNDIPRVSAAGNG